jgi:predicted nucleotidyltransferase
MIFAEANMQTDALAETILATLRAHRDELRAAGLRHLSLFGSVARGEAGSESDIDLMVELDPQARLGLFGIVALERQLGDLLGCKVDLIPALVERPRLLANIRRDSRRAF